MSQDTVEQYTRDMEEMTVMFGAGAKVLSVVSINSAALTSDTAPGEWSLTISNEMFLAIRRELQYLELHDQQKGRAHISVSLLESHDQSTLIRVSGGDTKAIASAKIAVEEILAGSIAKNGDENIWDDFFSTPKGLIYLRDLGRWHKTMIRQDALRSRITIWGSVEVKDKVERDLLKKSWDLLSTSHIIKLTDDTLDNALRGAFGRIVSVLGKRAASFQLASEPKTITIYGSIHDLRRAEKILYEDISSQIAVGQLDNEENCAVCWTSPADAYDTFCGHKYCKDCFLQQCSSAGSECFPIKCLGAAGACGHIFTLPELKNALPAIELEELLMTSFAAFIRTHTNEYQYCPTPGCSQIYKLTTEGTVILCRKCLSSICTNCNVVAHHGVSCQEYQAMLDEGAFSKWKAENNVKDCPKCKTPLEKMDGCNHMTCEACGAHICWFCMALFDDGSGVYEHMRVVHGDFGVEGEEEAFLE